MPQSPLLFSRRRVLQAASAIGALAFAPPLHAATPPQAVPLSAQDKADVGRVVAYLNNIHTMQAHFEQIAADGSDSSGVIDIERPGKLRLQYNPPVPILIVSNGREVYYWDSKLEQLSQTLIDDTPAWFLLRPDIKAADDVTVTAFQREANFLRLTMVETEHADLGSVTLTMTENPMVLKQWMVVDAQRRPVTVTLIDPKFGMPLDPWLFNWVDPRISQGLRR